MSNEIDYAADETDDTFATADTHQLFGQELYPLTPERFVAAQMAGLLWPGVVAQGPRNTLLYKGQANDAMLVLWITSIPHRSEDKSEWTVLRARRDPDGAYEEATRWAKDKGILAPNSNEFWEAINKFVDIITDINLSYTKPVAVEGAPPTSPKS